MWINSTNRTFLPLSYFILSTKDETESLRMEVLNLWSESLIPSVQIRTSFFSEGTCCDSCNLVPLECSPVMFRGTWNLWIGKWLETKRRWSFMQNNLVFPDLRPKLSSANCVSPTSLVLLADWLWMPSNTCLLFAVGELCLCFSILHDLVGVMLPGGVVGAFVPFFLQ